MVIYKERFDSVYSSRWVGLTIPSHSNSSDLDDRQGRLLSARSSYFLVKTP